MKDAYWKCVQLFSFMENEFNYRRYLLEQWKTVILGYRTVFLCGCGQDGRSIVDFLEDEMKDCNIYFIDSDSSKHGRNVYKGIDCFGKERIYDCEPSTSIILIASSSHADEIFREIIALKSNFTGTRINRTFIDFFHSFQNSLRKIPYKEKLLQVLNLFEDEQSFEVFWHRLLYYFWGIQGMYEVATYPQYFPAIIKESLLDDSVFLDLGASYGDSIEDFRAHTNDCFKAIYSFEMDSSIYERLRKSEAVNDPRITIFHAGVSNCNRRVRYTTEGGCPSYVTGNFPKDEVHYADVVSIDELVKSGEIKDKITFVKMDIEGAELDALYGMKEVLCRDEPNLAICVYHKEEDLWEIPIFLHQTIPNYKFMLRHHSKYESETVLYAYK